ncbi:MULTISPECIES: hypothetical protein [Candidatus Rhabdochlamydia]|uniref:hypothetical protein n=1 Tax=Candidatus Rhabdochlamydia TaxID=292833 RepID=UPI001BFCB650|nr:MULTISPECIES: hypothetical protein [Rhabdochlamydia]KAG6559697.1 hypothetical protein RHOW815_000289 [Candidatus Rhabdochlamydia sp. W815]MCL6756675.1 hypothetical protein [Candidatus Rhabdochlamydia oedothoracis]
MSKTKQNLLKNEMIFFNIASIIRAAENKEWTISRKIQITLLMSCTLGGKEYRVKEEVPSSAKQVVNFAQNHFGAFYTPSAIKHICKNA